MTILDKEILDVFFFAQSFCCKIQQCQTFSLTAQHLISSSAHLNAHFNSCKGYVRPCPTTECSIAAESKTCHVNTCLILSGIRWIILLRSPCERCT